jgi:hypothetical protein
LLDKKHGHASGFDFTHGKSKILPSTNQSLKHRPGKDLGFAQGFASGEARIKARTTSERSES